MVITLLTDFGDRDGFVGAMKGVILSIAPEVQVVDIAHDIPPGDIAHASRVLAFTAPVFPPGTVHVVVVDPGVGTDRRGLTLTLDDHRYVGPDNGVFSGVMESAKGKVDAVSLTRSTFWREPVSRTFHGRDIFAPVAAHLAKRLPVSMLGESVPVDSLVKLPAADPERNAAGWAGRIRYVDRFGNAVTNLAADALAGLGAQDHLRIAVGALQLEGVRPAYGSVATGEAVAVIGSSGHLEIAINGGSAAERLGLRVGDPVGVTVTSEVAPSA